MNAVVPGSDEATALAVIPPREPLERSPAAVYLARLAPGSRRTMRTALEAIARIAARGEADALSFPWSSLRYAHAQAIRAVLAERYAPATANRHLAALRGVLKEAWRLGDMTVEDYQRAADVEVVRGERLPAGREIGGGELRALFGACAADTTAAGARDAALLAVLYAGGLRRSEAVALDVTDLDLQTGALHVRSGKGRKARTVYVEAGREAVTAWLDVRGPAAGPTLRTAERYVVGGPFFLPIDKLGRIGSRRLTDQAVLWILKKRAEQAGIDHLSPHDLRRTCVSNLLDAGADIAVVQKIMGHANVQTTQRYDRRGEVAKRRASSLLHVPSSPRRVGA